MNKIPTKEEIENLIVLVNKFNSSKDSLADGSSYATASWWCEYCPNYIASTVEIILSAITSKQDTETLQRVFEVQSFVKIEGIPTIIEEVRSVNKTIYEIA